MERRFVALSDAVDRDPLLLKVKAIGPTGSVERFVLGLNEVTRDHPGSPYDEEKAKLCEVAEKLPEAQRELVLKRFWLEPKKK